MKAHRANADSPIVCILEISYFHHLSGIGRAKYSACQDILALSSGKVEKR